MMPADPISAFIIAFDTKMDMVASNCIAGLVLYLPTPLATSASLVFLQRGIRILKGEPIQLGDLVTKIALIGIVLYLVGNLDVFNYWVRDLLFKGVGTALGNAVAGSSGNPEINGIASNFAQIWGQMWVAAGRVWEDAGLFDPISRAAAILSVLSAGVALEVMALVYIGTQFLLTIVCILAPICIGLLIHESTKPTFERWLGKAISLICLEVCVVIVLQMILAGNQQFMQDMLATRGDLTAQLASLVSMVVWFFLGAFALICLPAVAYSIGGGVAVSTLPGMLTMLLATRMLSNRVRTTPPQSGPIPLSPVPPLPNYGLSVARPEIGAGSTPRLPPPPPPSLTHATPLLPRS